MTKQNKTVFRVGPNYSGWQSLFCLIGAAVYLYWIFCGKTSVIVFAVVLPFCLSVWGR